MAVRGEASALIKEFRTRDLQRMRNLKMGKLHDPNGTQVGYKKVEVRRKEGEIFIEKGQEYIIKNGIQVKNSKLSKIREDTKIPIFCPCCNKAMSSYVDKKMYKMKKICLDCNVKIESKMKLDGTFKAYQENYINQNYKSNLIDFKNYIIDFSSNQAPVVNSVGDIEEFNGPKMDISKVLKDIDDELATL